LGEELEARDVRARARLGETEGHQREALREALEPLLLLLGRPRHEDRREPEVVAHDRGGHPGAAPGQLLHHQAAVEEAQADAAVLGGDRYAREPELPRLLDDLPGKLAALVVLSRLRRDLLLGEAARSFLERELLVAEPEVHDGPRCVRAGMRPKADSRSQSRSIPRTWRIEASDARRRRQPGGCYAA